MKYFIYTPLLVITFLLSCSDGVGGGGDDFPNAKLTSIGASLSEMTKSIPSSTGKNAIDSIPNIQTTASFDLFKDSKRDFIGDTTISIVKDTIFLFITSTIQNSTFKDTIALSQKKFPSLYIFYMSEAEYHSGKLKEHLRYEDSPFDDDPYLFNPLALFSQSIRVVQRVITDTLETLHTVELDGGLDNNFITIDNNIHKLSTETVVLATQKRRKITISAPNDGESAIIQNVDSCVVQCVIENSGAQQYTLVHFPKNKKKNYLIGFNQEINTNGGTIKTSLKNPSTTSLDSLWFTTVAKFNPQSSITTDSIALLFTLGTIKQSSSDDKLELFHRIQQFNRGEIYSQSFSFTPQTPILNSNVIINSGEFYLTITFSDNSFYSVAGELKNNLFVGVATSSDGSTTSVTWNKDGTINSQ